MGVRIHEVSKLTVILHHKNRSSDVGSYVRLTDRLGYKVQKKELFIVIRRL